MIGLAGWATVDIAIGVVLGLLVGVVYMLVKITTGNGRHRDRED